MTVLSFAPLQEAGKVLHLARSGRLILKASSSIKEGSILVDDKGRRTGKVLEIIGPASAPYLSVQPFTDRIHRITGEKLYLSEESPREERRGSMSQPRQRRPRDDRPHGDSDKRARRPMRDRR